MSTALISDKTSRIAKLVLIVLALMFSSNAAAQTVDDLAFVTEDYAPLNFKIDGKIQGISVDVLVEMLALIGSEKRREDIKLVPWARGYKMVLEKKNTALFAMTFTKDREDLFKWVGPIMPSNIVLLAKKNRKFEINSIEDVKEIGKIGVVREDVGEQVLLQLGVQEKKILRSNSPKNVVQMLHRDRIRMWAYGRVPALWYIKEFGYDSGDYEEVYTLEESHQYFAFHKDTDDKVIQRLQEALDELKDSGKLNEIVNKYLY